MKNFDKKKDSTVLEANGIDKDRFVVQYNKDAPHIRLYERKKRGNAVIHSKVNQFYNFKKTVQCAWAISNGAS